MAGQGESHAGPDGVEYDDRSSALAYLIFGGLLVLLLSIVVIVISSLGEEDDRAQATDPDRAALLAELPPYWTVRRGDTYVRIAEETGLTLDELETFNPRVDPSTIQPGQKLKLRRNVPQPRSKPLGPKYVTVRSGESFGSIAAKTGKSIARLQQLNPKLKPASLQPGDRMRLR